MSEQRTLDLAARWRVSDATIIRMCQRGELDAFKVGAQLGHRKRTQQYIEVTPAMLRPWVERWAGMVLPGESGARKLSSDVL